MEQHSSPVGPLHGVRVCELSTVLAGPYCAMVLADLGADVVKVEPPEGDATRGYGPPWVGDGEQRVAAYYLAVNRNKRSLRLDLRRSEGRAVLERLLASSDALIENFRPGGLERLGLDDAALAALNPRLVHLAITGFGPTGPDAGRPGYDFIAQAVGGLMSITGFPDESGGQPTKVGVAISDIVTGLFGAIGLVAALRSGQGQRIDVSLLDSTLAVLINQAQNAFVSGVAPGRLGNAHPNIVPYETFVTADGEIAVAVGSERQWPRLCDALDLAALALDTRFADNDARVRNRAALRPILAQRFAAADSSHWLGRLDAAQVPCGPVNDLLDAFAQPQATARGLVVDVVHPQLGSIRQVASPIRSSASTLPVRRAPPTLGEHSDEILGELGYDAGQVAHWRAAGVI